MAEALPQWAELYAALPRHEFVALHAWASTFYPFQRDWLFEQKAYAVANKARQIGFSHTTSALGVIWGAFHGELSTIISVGELESGEVLDKAKRHALVLRDLGSKMAVLGRESAKEISFASGGRILALPSTGGRSFSGNVILDEYAYQEHAKGVWESAAAVTTLGNARLRVLSTPNGMGNEFEQLWNDVSPRDPKWARHEVDIDRAVADGYPLDLAKCWTIAKGDPRLFDQLFRCKFLDGAEQYIPTALIASCSVDDLYTYEGEFYGGLDIGRTNDRTTLVVVRKVGGVRMLQWIESRKRTNSDELQELVDWGFEVFKFRRFCPDETGLGAFPCEQMQKRHGKTRVEPVSFTMQSKEDLATGMHTGFAEQTVRVANTTAALRLPDHTAPSKRHEPEPGIAERLRDDICAIRREVTTAGNVRYDAPRTDKGHADSAWAFALALHASGSTPAGKHEIGPIERPPLTI